MRALASTPFLGTVIGVLTWPIRSIAPTTGPDPSWVAGLYMAVADGMRFGEEVVFTYGPLGFLQDAVLYDEGLWVLSFLYRGFIHVAVAISLLWVARRAFPLALALLLSYALLAIGYLEAEVMLLAFIWCFAALGERPPRFAAPLLVFGGGVLAGVELLGKANLGIAVFSLCAVTIAAMPRRRRNAPLFALVTLGTLVSLWTLAGQGWSNAPDFVSSTLRLVSGYSQAMSADISNVTWELPLAVAAAALLLAAAAAATRRDPVHRRLAALTLVALFAFLTFKQGFVRQGLGNTPDAFALILGAGMVISPGLTAQAARLPARLPAIALTVPLAALALAALPSPSIWESLKPDDHATFLRQGLDALLDRDERQRLIATSRRAMRSKYGLDRRTLRLLGDRPVHIDPWEIGVAWAYELNWRPLPVFQNYVAYTPELDALNADALVSGSGPAAILRQNTEAFAAIEDASIDERYPGWDPPKSQLQMLCHFRPVTSSPRWQLLAQAGNRCDRPRLMGVVRSTTARRIRVPPPPGPRSVVVARIDGIGVEGWESVRTALYRASRRTAIVNGRDSWRLVADTAGGGLIMRAGKRVDYPAPFDVAPDAATLRVRIHGAGERDVTVRFLAVRLRHFGGGPGRRPRLPIVQKKRLASR